MNIPYLAQEAIVAEPLADGDLFPRIVTGLRECGYVILDDVFSSLQLDALLLDINKTDSEAFHQAGVGREQDYQLNDFVRRDRICWLDMANLPSRFYLHWAERLRSYLNRELFLGLFDYECHYSHYPQGAFYKKHVDAFQGSSNRRLSSVLYLNPAWQPGDGGELVMYNRNDYSRDDYSRDDYSRDDNAVLETISPSFGKLVIFLSEEFPHEVLATQCSRYSLTGWYRINTTTGLNIDPPL